MNDDLNAPRAVAAMFTFMNEGNAALDAGERPGPESLAAWEMAEGVLGVTSRGTIISVPTGTATLDGQASEVSRPVSETPPAGSDEELHKAWALHWALKRKQAKTDRNYPEADRIRALLRSAGWEVRDGKDGSIEVIRIRRAS